MLDSPILEVVLSIVFIYILLSILVTQMNTVVSTLLKLRAKHLRQGISEMIDDPILRAKLFTHPLVRMVKGELVLPDQHIDEADAERISKGAVTDVSWIDPRTFVNVLMTLIRVDSDGELFGAMLDIVDGMPAGPERRRLRLIVNKIMNGGEGLDELRAEIATLEEPVYRQALSKALDQIDDEIGRLGLEPNSVISLMAGLRNIKNPYFRTALDTILATARTLDEAEDQLAAWFDDGMGRVGQRFARTMQILTMTMGLLLAVVLNVDSLNLAFSLWNDPILRTTVATVVQQVDIDALEETITESETLAESTPETTEQYLENTGQAAVAAGATLNQIVELNLPIGWKLIDLSDIPSDTTNILEQKRLQDATNLWNYIPFANPNWLGMWLVKIIGLGATVLALSQGAPFWFSLLRRITGGSSKTES
ncbi:MAG: hypothetical protein ACPG7F_15455 [Aggregatilineales bacterium]